MSRGLSERRLAENELIFRQANQKVQKSLKRLQQLAAKEDNPELYAHKGDVHFYCECADEKCSQRIALSPSEYEELHQNRSQFILIPGHEVVEVERVLFETPRYEVVEKYAAPPKFGNKLHKTKIDNT
jgi:hypothetical protein